MNRTDAERVISAESLTAGVWFARPDQLANRVAIYGSSGRWVVSVTGERGTEEGVRTFGSESDALEDFVARLRVQQRLLDRGVL